MRKKKPISPDDIDSSDTDPAEEDDFDLDELDADAALQLDDDYWEALLPENDYEPLPEYGDFWID